MSSLYDPKLLSPRTLFPLASCVAFVCFTHWIVVHVQTWRRRRILRKAHGCKPAAKSCLQHPMFLGIDFMISQTINVMNHKFAERIRESFQQCGVTYTGRILRTRFVATLDPRNLETIMKTRFDDYNIIPGRGKLIRILFGDGVFSTDGDQWKHSRELVRHGLQHVSHDTERFEKHAQAFLARLRACENQAFDFVVPTFAYSIDVATDILFGSSTNVQSADGPNTAGVKFARDFTFLGKMARVLTIMVRQIPYLAEIVFGKEYFLVQKRVFHHVDLCVQEALDRQDALKEQGPVIRPSVADGMARRSRDTERVRSELLNLLLAGHDTVGIALSELFYCLARKEDVWTKIRAEVLSVLEGRLPSQTDLKRLTYLTWTINEAIRIRPTLSVHARRAKRDTVLPRGGGPDGGNPLFVEKNQYVVYSNYALYRNPAVFGEDVDEFRPERWESAKPKTFEYLNFGAGPRSCPGKDMGWTMLAYITARLAQEIEQIRPMDNRPWQEAKAFSFHNRHGVHLAVKMAKWEQLPDTLNGDHAPGKPL